MFAKKLHYPQHYVDGQEPTVTGLRIHLDIQSIDFTSQLKGGPNSALSSNPDLFKSEPISNVDDLPIVVLKSGSVE